MANNHTEAPVVLIFANLKQTGDEKHLLINILYNMLKPVGFDVNEESVKISQSAYKQPRRARIYFKNQQDRDRVYAKLMHQIQKGKLNQPIAAIQDWGKKFRVILPKHQQQQPLQQQPQQQKPEQQLQPQQMTDFENMLAGRANRQEPRNTEVQQHCQDLEPLTERKTAWQESGQRQEQQRDTNAREQREETDARKQREREQQEEEARERWEREQREKEALERWEREQREQEAQEQWEREQHEKEARQKWEREQREKNAREQWEREQTRRRMQIQLWQEEKFREIKRLKDSYEQLIQQQEIALSNLKYDHKEDLEQYKKCAKDKHERELELEMSTKNREHKTTIEDMRTAHDAAEQKRYETYLSEKEERQTKLENRIAAKSARHLQELKSLETKQTNIFAQELLENLSAKKKQQLKDLDALENEATIARDELKHVINQTKAKLAELQRQEADVEAQRFTTDFKPVARNAATSKRRSGGSARQQQCGDGHHGDQTQYSPRRRTHEQRRDARQTKSLSSPIANRPAFK